METQPMVELVAAEPDGAALALATAGLVTALSLSGMRIAFDSVLCTLLLS
jgi:hypothetical protein